MANENTNKSVMGSKLSIYEDKDLTLTPEEEAMWNEWKEERESVMAYNKRKFKILLVVYILLFILVIVVMSFIVYRMVNWDYLRKLIVLNSKTLGTNL